jgi:transcriptional regulator of heat shock response
MTTADARWRRCELSTGRIPMKNALREFVDRLLEFGKSQKEFGNTSEAERRRSE